MKQMTQRQIQASEIFKRKLADFWRTNDSLVSSNLKQITFIEVRLTPDFSTALIFYTHSLDDKLIQTELKAVNKSVRFELAKLVEMKTMPQLKFEKDMTLDFAKKIDDILNSPKVKEDLQK